MAGDGDDGLFRHTHVTCVRVAPRCARARRALMGQKPVTPSPWGRERPVLATNQGQKRGDGSVLNPPPTRHHPSPLGQKLLNQRRVPLGPPCGGVRRPKPVVKAALLPPKPGTFVSELVSRTRYHRLFCGLPQRMAMAGELRWTRPTAGGPAREPSTNSAFAWVRMPGAVALYRAPR